MSRYKLCSALLVALVVTPAVASADGPSGSKESSNQVKCGEGTETPAGKLYGGSNGIELCSDDNDSPDGRIIVDFGAQYAAADGDNDNGQASSFIRLDSGGPTCGSNQKSDATAGPGETCP